MNNLITFLTTRVHLVTIFFADVSTPASVLLQVAVTVESIVSPAEEKATRGKPSVDDSLMRVLRSFILQYVMRCGNFVNAKTCEKKKCHTIHKYTVFQVRNSCGGNNRIPWKWYSPRATGGHAYGVLYQKRFFLLS